MKRKTRLGFYHFECLTIAHIHTDLPSPEIVAAQGALVSVGSSYVTYIDKKGQVR